MDKVVECLSRQEQAIKGFMRDYLNKPKDGQTFYDILANMGEYYDADRAGIFELDADHAEVRNAHEWCREGKTAQLGSLQTVSADGLEAWFAAFKEKGEFIVSSLTEEYAPDSKTY